MYTYEKSSCLVRTIGTRWEDIDIKDVPLSEVYRKYLQAYIQVFDDLVDVSVFINLDTYRSELCGSSVTVQQWLDSMAGKPLITVPEFPTAKLTHAHYENAVLRKYKIVPAKAGFSFPPETPLSELKDLAITRPGYPTDISILHTHCLLSVNGYYHRSDTDGTTAFILDGGTTANMKRCSHTGILSFLEIGKINQVTFKDEDIYPVTEGGLLKDGFVLRIPEEFKDHARLLILGGYLMQPENGAVFQNSETTLIIQPLALPLIERYFESRAEIDLSSIVVEAPLANKDNAILVESLYTDENIRAWLKLSQSFFAFVDTPDLYMERIYLRVSTLPGLITSYQEPVYPTIMGYGKTVEYSKIKEVGFWALRIQDSFYKQYAFQKAPIMIQPVVTENLVPWATYRRSQGYMLRITGKKQ